MAKGERSGTISILGTSFKKERGRSSWSGTTVNGGVAQIQQAGDKYAGFISDNNGNLRQVYQKPNGDYTITKTKTPAMFDTKRDAAGHIVFLAKQVQKKK